MSVDWSAGPQRTQVVPPGIEVIHVDEHLIVLNKPAGLLSVPGRGPDNADCLSARVQSSYPDALVVHRLDMGTSGLLLMARGPQAQSQLSRAFASRQVHKQYEAVVLGRPQTQAGADDWNDIELPLIVDWPNRPRSKVDWKDGKPSHTRWRVLQAEDAAFGLTSTRLRLEPITGRSHQLRVHLQAIGHPILGDELYACETGLNAAPRLLLHAMQLEVPHPQTEELMVFESLPPF